MIEEQLWGLARNPEYAMKLDYYTLRCNRTGIATLEQNLAAPKSDKCRVKRSGRKSSGQVNPHQSNTCEQSLIATNYERSLSP